MRLSVRGYGLSNEILLNVDFRSFVCPWIRETNIFVERFSLLLQVQLQYYCRYLSIRGSCSNLLSNESLLNVDFHAFVRTWIRDTNKFRERVSLLRQAIKEPRKFQLLIIK